MGYHISIHDKEQVHHEMVYFSGFLPARHQRWYFGDPTDCFVYFHNEQMMMGSPDSEDFSGEWEPDWDFCLKMAFRLREYVHSWQATDHPQYADHAEELLAKRDKDLILYEQIITVCRRGVEDPGRYTVSISY